MPTYGYECKSCGHTFDAFQSIKDEPLKKCPMCGKGIRRLINGGSGVIFKGGGFYATDKGGMSKTGKPDNAPKADPVKTGADSTPCAGCAKSDTCPKASGQ